MTFFAFGFLCGLVAVGAAYLTDNGPLMICGWFTVLLSLFVLDAWPTRRNRRASRDLERFGQTRVGYPRKPEDR